MSIRVCSWTKEQNDGHILFTETVFVSRGEELYKKEGGIRGLLYLETDMLLATKHPSQGFKGVLWSFWFACQSCIFHDVFPTTI